MIKPGDNDEILLVAILRFLKKTQDEVAEILSIGKKRVVAIEDWIRTEPLAVVEGLFIDYRLKKVIEDRLSDIQDIEPRDLVRAARIAADDVLQHYRNDYSQKQPTQGFPGDITQADLETSKLYQAHQRDMARLVERLSNELDPHLSACRLRELGDPKKLDPDSFEWATDSNYSLVWQVTSCGLVYLCYPLGVAQDPQTCIVRGYLEQHLRSSPYCWLLEDKDRGIDRWKELGGEELRQRIRLLNTTDRAVEKLINKPLTHPNQMTHAGPSTWFSESIWMAVLDGIYENLDYRIESIGGELFKAQYGATFIGLTVTKEEGERYVELHKALMGKFRKSRMTLAVNRLRTQREAVTRDIREVLAKFTVDRYIPGKCDYSFCRPMVKST